MWFELTFDLLKTITSFSLELSLFLALVLDVWVVLSGRVSTLILLTGCLLRNILCLNGFCFKENLNMTPSSDPPVAASLQLSSPSPTQDSRDVLSPVDTCSLAGPWKPCHCGVSPPVGQEIAGTHAPLLWVKPPFQKDALKDYPIHRWEGAPG